MADPVLSVRALEVTFVGSGRPVPAVRGIDLKVHQNEVLGIVGESGSGKSVASLAIAGLLPDTAAVKGSIVLVGGEVVGAKAERLRQMRGQDVGFIFQDPTTTLNPVLPVGRQITEGQVAHGRLAASEAGARAVELLREVDIADPAGRARQYPHQFSGGMRQRGVIAMAMSGRPRLIIADEPTTALDVTVQAQILDLLKELTRETGSSLILITHDLGVVARYADRVAVMYGGRIVEVAPARELYARPQHPYTSGLMASVPRLDGGGRRLMPIEGQPPDLASLPAGCSFSPRCRAILEQCRTARPELVQVGDRHSKACFANV